MKILQSSISDKEIHEMIELIEDVYTDVEIKNAKYINWQYIENPQGKAIIVLCYDDKKENIILGQESIIPSNLNSKNKTIQASISLNSIVHTKFRRRGIFSKLVNALPELALKNGIVCAYGVPNSSSYHAFLKEGWKEITRLPLLVRILKPSDYFNNVLNKVLKPFNFCYKINNFERLGIEEYEGDFSDLEILAAKLPARFQVSQNRNQSYLKWRYANHPTRKYKIRIIKKESEIIAYIITRETDYKGKHIGIILDFVTNGEKNNEKEFVNLVKFALLELQDQNVALTIATFHPTILEYKILRKAGFFKVPEFMKPEPLPLIVKNFDKNDQELKNIENYNNWFFTFGDYGVF